MFGTGDQYEKSHYSAKFGIDILQKLIKPTNNTNL